MANSSISNDWLIVIRNASGGTQFGSAFIPAANIPEAIVVIYGNANTMVFSRNGRTLSYNPVSNYSVYAYER